MSRGTARASNLTRTPIPHIPPPMPLPLTLTPKPTTNQIRQGHVRGGAQRHHMAGERSGGRTRVAPR